MSDAGPQRFDIVRTDLTTGQKTAYHITLNPRDDEALAGILLHEMDPNRWPRYPSDDQSEGERLRLAIEEANTLSVSRSSSSSEGASASNR